MNLQDMISLLLTLLGGIGLNLTPCVLPMIPINLAIIGNFTSKVKGCLCATRYNALDNLFKCRVLLFDCFRCLLRRDILL